MPSTTPEQTELLGAPSTPKFQAPKKKRKWPRRVIITVAVVVVAALVLNSFLSGTKEAISTAYIPAQVSRQSLSVTVTGTGTVKPNDTYRATTLLRGEVLTAPFEEGDQVVKDQVLFTIDATDAENAVKQAEIALEQAKNAVARAQAGVDQAASGVTQAQAGVEQADNATQRAQAGADQANLGVSQAQSGVERSQLAIQQAQLSVDSAQLNYDALLRQQKDNAKDRQIKANATGTVSKLYIDPGDQVAAGTPIGEILDRDHMKLVAPFHAAVAKDFTVGQAATVTVTGKGDTLTGVITDLAAVDTAGAGGTRVRQVTIQVDNPGTLSTSSTGTAQVGEASSAAVGAFTYADSAQLVATYSGKVERLDVQEGSAVTDGQVIGEFEEQASLQDQIDAAAITLQNAQSALANAQLGLSDSQLAVDNAVLSQSTAQTSLKDAQLAQQNAQVSLSNTQTSVDTAQIALSDALLAQQNAENNLQTARDNLDDYTIKSPIAGTVIEKNYKEGDNVDASTAATSGADPYLAIVYDLSRLTFDMNVSELDVSQLKVGQQVTFTADALEGMTFTGHVDKININGTTVNGVTNYPVTVVVDDGEGLYPGMNVSATIVVEELGNVLTLPVDAIQRGNLVYVAAPGALNSKGELVDPTKLEERQVELGRNDSDHIEILSGLEEGDTVYIPNAASNTMQNMMQLMGG